MYQINKCAFQWKMSFNPDPSKQAQKVIFSIKTKQISYSPLRFKNGNVSQLLYQKHLGIFPDAQITFEEHLKVITTELNKTIGLIRKFPIYFTKTSINGYIQSFCESTSRL